MEELWNADRFLIGGFDWQGREHGRRAAHKAIGLESTLVDHSPVEIRALDEADPRRITLKAAENTVLLVAKLHKIDDPRRQPDRLTDKDAVDVLCLFMSTTTDPTAQGLCELLGDGRSAEMTRIAIDLLDSLFGTPRSRATQMAVRVLTGVLDPTTVHATCPTFVARVLEAFEEAWPR